MKPTLTCLCALLTCLSAFADPITIGDPSFEGNTLSAGQWTNDLSPEWQETNGPNNGNGFEEYITGFVGAGTDHLGMAEGHDVWQDLGVTYQANTRYTLTVAVGNRPGATQSGNLSQFYLADSIGTIFASGSLDAAASVASGSFADAAPLVFETPANPSAVGQTIRILLHAGGSGRSHFDNIRLETEPYALTGTATVEGLSATGIGSTTATLNGLVSDIGNGAPSLTFYWGPVNGGTTPGSWAKSVTLPGTYGVGAFATSLTGLSPATVYYFTARATNSAGSTWALPVAQFETLPQPPTVATTPVSGVSATGATLGANVTSTGGEAPTVTLYYGTTDGGTTSGAWQGSVGAGVVSGATGVPVTGLTPSTLYYFRAYAENGGGGVWSSSSLSFSTLNVGPPSVESRTPEGITGTTANLRGEITDTGNDPPVVTLFYGTSDGGTTPGSWAVAADCGAQSGEFTRFVSGLSATTPYFFRWRAVNAHGTSWSPESGSFTTTAPIPSGVVINEIHYHPADDTSAEEFIELYNPGDTAVDISGWTITDAITYTIPAGTTVPVRGYRVVAQNPAVLQTKYGITGVLGPWSGNLSSAGEKIDLRDVSGALRDRVGYGAGFPWPTGADGAGQSCELIHPGLDNDLGGSWRSSYNPGNNGTTFIATSSTGWKYLKGTAEPSSPVDGWRAVAYDDNAWLSGSQPMGYNSKYGNVTTLSDMQNNYWSVYLRKTFTVPANQIPDSLTLRLLVDDGCIVWINGTEVARTHMPAGHVAYNAAANNHDATAWETFTLSNTSSYLLGGTNVIAIQVNNSSLSSSDLTINSELTAGSVTATSNPSPGTTNGVSALATAIPPQIRQVAHSPVSPAANQPVTITARITDPDGMGAVSLSYQTVEPGSYVRKTDAAYSTSWTTVEMADNGANGDAVAGDSTFTAVLPASLQVHRRLVRYKITFADALGNSQTVPYADDEQPNFAYFVYNGVPAWTGALRPYAYSGFAATTPQTYSSALLESKPPFHLIANASDVSTSQSGNTTIYYATVVHRGIVHDHVRFRVRGIGSTTVSGKNKWNIYFNRSRDFQAYDNYNRPYKETWNNLLVNCNASPWASVHRGSAGVEEALCNRIYQLGGMASMNTFQFHFRVIDDAVETSPTDQFSGDLWGLYMGLEPTEGNFLDERGLADGNLYSIEGGGGDKKHQGPTQPVDSSDWSSFSSTLAATGTTEQWYRDNVDLSALYTFLALNRLTGNVDVRPGDNYRFYHRPTDNRWVIIPYDLDMQFIAAHHWGGTMDQIVGGSTQSVIVAGAPNVIRAIGRHPNLAREFRNRCRELLSLMASDGAATGGQIGQLVDETARFVNPPGEALTWADLDAAMWNLNPKTTGSLGANSGQSSHKGNFLRAYYLDGGRGAGGPTATGTWIRSLSDPDADGFSDHEGLMQWFTDFATNTWPGGTWIRKAGA
ncbi:MAG: lamin tail domain-containing protein, partial [Verrucomicrobia bacterium]|nr:lamin tail domain-containing protein [Verrucomicrobiota bacterium]